MWVCEEVGGGFQAHLFEVVFSAGQTQFHLFGEAFADEVSDGLLNTASATAFHLG